MKIEVNRPNWIGIIDVGTTQSSLSLMSYEASFSDLSSFPASSFSIPFSGISNQSSSSTELINNIMAEATESIPIKFHKSGVLGIYSTPSIPKSTIDIICAHAQKTSKLRVLECQQLDTDQRAALAWTANFAAHRKPANYERRVVIEVEGTNLVIINDKQDTFNSTETLELGFPTGWGKGLSELQLNQVHFLSELEPEELNSCIPARGGNHAQCQVALNHPIQRIIDPLPVSNYIRLDGMSEWTTHAHTEERLHALCSENDSLDCLEAMLKYKVAKHVREKLAHSNISMPLTAHSWKTGRGLLYAAAQLAPETDPAAVGFRRPGTTQMELGSGPLPMQPAVTTDPEKLNHILGSLVLLAMFAGVVYLVLGSARRRKIRALLTGHQQWARIGEEDSGGQIELEDVTPN